jgi:hypothetical protein
MRLYRGADGDLGGERQTGLFYGAAQLHGGQFHYYLALPATPSPSAASFPSSSQPLSPFFPGRTHAWRRSRIEVVARWDPMETPRLLPSPLPSASFLHQFLAAPTVKSKQRPSWRQRHRTPRPRYAATAAGGPDHRRRQVGAGRGIGHRGMCEDFVFPSLLTTLLGLAQPPR